MRPIALALVLALALSGCAGALGAGLAVDAIATAVGAHQNYKARQEEAAKVEALKNLGEDLKKVAEELRLLREQMGLPPRPLEVEIP